MRTWAAGAGRQQDGAWAGAYPRRKRVSRCLLFWAGFAVRPTWRRRLHRRQRRAAWVGTFAPRTGRRSCYSLGPLRLRGHRLRGAFACAIVALELFCCSRGPYMVVAAGRRRQSRAASLADALELLAPLAAGGMRRLRVWETRLADTSRTAATPASVAATVVGRPGCDRPAERPRMCKALLRLGACGGSAAAGEACVAQQGEYEGVRADIRLSSTSGHGTGTASKASSSKAVRVFS